MYCLKRSLLALPAALLLLVPSAARAQWVTARSTDNIVCDAAWNQNHVVTVSDGAGGFVSVWQDQRSGARDDIYAQSFDANGFARWTTNGVLVDATLGTPFDLKACPDDSGGVIVSWVRSGGPVSDRICAQRIDANGQRRWGAGGMRVSTAEMVQSLPRISRDEQGGAIVVWANWKTSNVANVCGQRLDRDGNRLWSASGDSLVARGEVRSLTVTRRPGGGVFIGYWYTFGPLGMVAVDNARTRVMSDTITTAAAFYSPPSLYCATAGNGAYLMMAGGYNMNIRWFGANGDRWPASRRPTSSGARRTISAYCSAPACCSRPPTGWTRARFCRRWCRARRSMGSAGARRWRRRAICCCCSTASWRTARRAPPTS